MKFNSNLENYKKDQEKIDVIPTIKTEVHYCINDGARSVIEGTVFNEQDKNILESVWDELQSLDRDLLSLIENYRVKGTINDESALIVSSHFLVTMQIGPDSSDIKERFYRRSDTEESFRQALFRVSIPEHTREVLADTYRRIIANF